MRFFFRAGLGVLILAMLALVCPAQESAPQQNKQGPKTKRERLEEKRKARKQKKQEKAEEKGRKHQMAIQTKETQKRMKRSRKEADRINAKKKKPFWETMFQRKQKKVRKKSGGKRKGA
jgi:hypothetical protein